MTPIPDKHVQQDAQPRFDAAIDEIARTAGDTAGSDPDAWHGEPRINNGRREELIAVAAYFIAERRQFQNGSPEDDWLQAEAEIDRQLAMGSLPA